MSILAFFLVGIALHVAGKERSFIMDLLLSSGSIMYNKLWMQFKVKKTSIKLSFYVHGMSGERVIMWNQMSVGVLHI